ncbi:hypothetical protein D3C77_502150 [compost metagenome]
MSGHDDHDGRHHDEVGRQRMLFQIAQGIPAKGADGHHNHHSHECRHRDFGEPFAKKYHHQQQENAGTQCRETGAATRFHVDDRLADHGATCHAAKHAGSDVGHTLAFALAVFVAGGIGQVVDDGRGHH